VFGNVPRLGGIGETVYNSAESSVDRHYDPDKASYDNGGNNPTERDL
jgi:hypothetical protein